MIENQQKQILLERIINHDFEFSDDDLYLIKNNEDLVKAIANQINQLVDYSLANNLDISYYRKIITLLADVCIRDELASYFNTNCLLQVAYQYIDTYLVSFFELEMVIDTLNLNDNLKAKIFDYYEKALKNNKYDDIVITDKTLLETLLKFERYDLLQNAKIDFEISDELLNELITSFKKNNIKVNVDSRKMFFFYKDIKEVLSFDALLCLIEERIQYNESFDEILPLLNQELAKEYDNSTINLDHDWKLIFSTLPEGYKEKIVNKLRNGIKSGSEIIEYFPDDNINQNRNSLSIIEDFMDLLIEYGKINLASKSPSFSKYVNQIIELINAKSPYYEKLSLNTLLGEYPEDYQELVKCFIFNGIRYNINDSFDLFNSIFIEAFEKEITNFNLGTSNFIPNQQLLDIVISRKNYQLLKKINWRKIDYQNLDNKKNELLKQYLQENIAFAEYFLNNNVSALTSGINFLNNIDFLELILSISPRFLDTIISFISHNDGIIKQINKESLDCIVNSIVAYSNLNKEHFMELKNRFGYEILIYYQNENIKDIINLPDLQFNKLLDLFSVTEYKNADLETAYDSIKQYEFAIKNPAILSIFNNILVSIENNDVKYLEQFNELEKIMDERFYDYFYSKHKEFSQMNFSSARELLLFIVSKIKNGNFEEKKDYKNILHTITTYYLDRLRGLYRKEYDVYRDLQIPYEYESKNAQNELIYKLITDDWLNFEIKYGSKKTNEKSINSSETFQEILIIKMIETGFEEQLAYETMYYYVNHRVPDNSKYNIKNIKENISHMIKIAKNCLELVSSERKKHLLLELDKENKLKRNYKLPKEEKNIYRILSELQINPIKNNLLDTANSSIYNTLYNMLKRSKIHLIPDCLIKYVQFFSPLNLSYNYEDAASFITYYYNIYKKYESIFGSSGKNIENFQLGLAEILVNASLYSGTSIDSLVLGNEDYMLIKSNPGPNSAFKLNASKRLSDSVERTFQCFRRDKVAIPTFNELINIDDKKSLRVIVGNFTHPSNLTHGERTGACMRIGGVGDSLYDFRLSNPYGFHIRFEDPNTSKYISRVSGFRNGNTVFLNELRYSCDSNLYSDKDIVLACLQVANKIIEKSKDSSLPIENVVISENYAMKEINCKQHQLNVGDIKKGLDGHFYSDISSSCIILATTEKEKPFVPVSLDNSNITMYKPAREIVNEITDPKKASEFINRIHLVKEKLETGAYEYTEVIITDDLIYCICNQDWYIYVDFNLQVHEELINVDERAIQEYNLAKVKIQEFIKQEQLKRGGELKHAV